jgi:serine/threonine protein kinase
VYQGTACRLCFKKRVAVKVYDFQNSQNELSFAIESTAHQVIKKLKSKYFSKTYSVEQTQQEGRMVMKLYDQDLFEYFLHNGHAEVPMQNIFYSICKGIEILHSNGIAHLDLKPENILMKGCKPFISDFGAIYVHDYAEYSSTSSRSFKGTLIYAPPEILHQQYFNPFSADIYSLGVLLHTCLTGAFPYLSNSRVLSLDYARQCISGNAYDLISRMLSQSAGSRPTIAKVLAHPWLSK